MHVIDPSDQNAPPHGLLWYPADERVMRRSSYQVSRQTDGDQSKKNIFNRRKEFRFSQSNVVGTFKLHDDVVSDEQFSGRKYRHVVAERFGAESFTCKIVRKARFNHDDVYMTRSAHEPGMRTTNGNR